MLLKEHNLTQSEVAGKVMRGEELPYAIAKEVFYLDAYNRITNLMNYVSKDKSDWQIKDYVGSLFESTMDWVRDNPNMMQLIKDSGNLDQMAPISDNELLPSLVLASIKRHEERKFDPSHNPEAA